ncbi:chemotaxis protein CheA [Desulfobacter hydrogenophilus]|uniref:Chemotaxis protein CheA n=1 Tax=Desulfobacter hydrogenophilus TaxID=2291 RepID=A0A328FG32_9BACT|nr:chemotaxis protein CheA [Desulfobacter hydrogenophilus]NDY70636.1 chemotaxis protein CheA [Desulfobacter hydrogenophilus]QBH14000.1 chemotaxis protein CheA [Desulfobacter hydrogenophilus]RAM03584.1 chemotaxis protein CheA [Desulfobacter hydrogenophilus]
MSYENIIAMTERLASELILFDPDQPDSIKTLLPILKSIHAQCKSLELSSEAAQILKARNIIDTIIKDGPQVERNLLSNLDMIVSNFSTGLKKMDEKESNRLFFPKLSQPDDKASNDDFKKIEKKLNEFSMLIAGFCPGKDPDMEGMIRNVDSLINISENIEPYTFYDISKLCKQYMENMAIGPTFNTRPIEEGLVLLKSILSHLKRKEPFTFDYSDVLELLEENLATNEQCDECVDECSENEPETESTQNSTPEKLSDDDIEILTDFISEAEENLNNIEVSLIELEQDPENADIINDIFRPFHTIKGVSGFLSLDKINRLSHATENLLDSARSGDFIINHSATDAILESVDLLKHLLDSVKQGLVSGNRQEDGHIDVEILRDKLKRLQISLTKGEKEPLGEILVRKKELTKQDIDHALEIQKKHPGKKVGEILIEDKKIAPVQVASALMEQSTVKRRVDSQVKVSTQKLDDLVDYAGELVIAQSMLRQQTMENSALSQTVSQLGQIVNNMQNIAMSMRMIPIKATFMKMIRLVRDLSRKSGKQINLSMTGEETEIDRNVVDALYEPMVHMIRNACDHGIESVQERKEKNKPQQGNIDLRAYHKGGNIVIEIEDDGKGLDREKIFEKATATGLITGEEQMTDAQIFNLVLAPGFSTANQITDVSGRGVGMDVVKEGIEKFRGHLNIESEKGVGSRFIISLPLTLAIIDGMLVRVDDEKYVIPTTAIQKAFRPGPGEYFTVEGKGEMVKDRGHLVPLIRLNEIYETSNHVKSVEQSLVVVIESKEEKRAFLIDELLGKDEYVIKNLGGNMDDIRGIAGGAILADGKVGLILDVHGIFSIVSGN